MPTMEELNAQLRALEEQEARRCKVESMLRDLQAQHREREALEQETAAFLEKEQADVDALEGFSLKGLLLNLSGKKEDRLEQERREVVTARLRHDQAVRDLDWLNQEHLRLTGERETMRDIPAQLERVRAEKRALLIAQGGETGRRLEELEEQLAALRARLRETEEALRAGREARIALEQVLGELKSARDMGVWDMVGGGLFVTMAKHDHINAARDGINHAQRSLSRFRSELADVALPGCPQVEIGEFATFADYFFDGLFADWVVQSGIRDAQDNVDQVYRRVLEAMARLEEIRRTTGAQIGALEQERDGFAARS